MKCTVTGKDVYTKQEARRAASALRAIRKGRGTSYPCPFGDHYHTTTNTTGRKGKGLR